MASDQEVHSLIFYHSNMWWKILQALVGLLICKFVRESNQIYQLYLLQPLNIAHSICSFLIFFLEIIDCSMTELLCYRVLLTLNSICFQILNKYCFEKMHIIEHGLVIKCKSVSYSSRELRSFSAI
jgi:hypothetical protein